MSEQPTFTQEQVDSALAVLQELPCDIDGDLDFNSSLNVLAVVTASVIGGELQKQGRELTQPALSYLVNGPMLALLERAVMHIVDLQTKCSAIDEKEESNGI